MPGVYAIVNKVNGRVYVGSTIQPFPARWGKHTYLLRNNKHKNPHFQASWNKYGGRAFELRVLQETDAEDVLVCEQAWLDFFRENGEVYNMGEIAQNGMLGRHHSEKVRAAQRELQRKTWLGRKHSEETKRKMSEAQKGKVVSEATRRKISRANSGEKNYWYGKSGFFKGKKHTEEAKRKIGEAQRGEKNSQYGKHRSEEECRKISEKLTGRTLPDWHRRRISEGQKGRKHSEETRRKMSRAQARSYPSLYNVETGEVIPSGTNIRKLCQERAGMGYSGVCSLVRGEIKKYKNWVLKEKEDARRKGA